MWHCLLVGSEGDPLLSVGIEGGDGSVDKDVRVPQAGPIAGTRPEPVGWSFDETASNGVVVDILNDVMDGWWIVEILVPPCARLPEPVVRAIRVDDRELLEVPGGVPFEKLNRLAPDGLLDRRENLVGLHLGIGHP